MSPATQIFVIGIQHELTPKAQKLLAQADIIYGSPRQLSMLKNFSVEKQTLYPSPFEKLDQDLKKSDKKNIVLLASGDPLWHGVGSWLIDRGYKDQMEIIPGLSSLQLAAAALKTSWQDIQVIQLHGRPFELLRRHLRGRTKYAVLTDANNHPQRIATEINTHDIEIKSFVIAENLGSNEQKLHTFEPPFTIQFKTRYVINIVFVETGYNNGYLPDHPGISDQAYLGCDDSGQGMITKKEIRLCALAQLQQHSSACAWDIGAGIGGLSIEWARWSPQSQIHAVENNSERFKLLHANRLRFGVIDNLLVYQAQALQQLALLPVPDAVFIGGSGQDLRPILEACWQRLKVKGIMVINSIRENARAELHEFCAGKSSQWMEISVRREDRLNDQRVLRPDFPILLVTITKT